MTLITQTVCLKGRKNLKEDLNSLVSKHILMVQDCIKNLLDVCCAYLEQMGVRLCLISGKCSSVFVLCVYMKLQEYLANYGLYVAIANLLHPGRVL